MAGTDLALKSEGGFLRQPWRVAAVALLAALFISNVYRAATQSITHDEAITWQWFLSGPFSLVFGSVNGNHHPLHTLLCKITVGLFGMSELSLRIPSLLGGLLYFYAVFRISALLFGEAFLFLLSVAFLTLNPFVLDYLSCARGYSAALGFFLLAVYQLTRYLSETSEPYRRVGPRRVLEKAGIGIGLAIASNVIMIFPAAALTAAFGAILLGGAAIGGAAPVENAGAADKVRKGKKERGRKQRQAARPATGATRAQNALLRFLIPAVAVGGFFAILPRRLVYLEVGYYGPPSLSAILEGLVRPSFLHSPGRLGLGNWFAPETVIRIVTNVVVPAALAALLIVTVRIIFIRVRRQRVDSLPVVDWFLLLLGGTLPAALLMIVVSRYVFEVPYPEQRTVLYWIPLLGLGCLGFVKRLQDGSRIGRISAALLGASLTLCVVQFVTQFNTRYYSEWSYCAATKEMMAVVRAQHASNPGRKVRVGATWQLEPGINFYRSMWGMDWMEPVFRESPDRDCDYYFLLYGDVALVQRRGLKPLLEDPLSGAVLAQPGKS